MTAILPPLFLHVAVTLVLFAVLASLRVLESLVKPEVAKGVKQGRSDIYARNTLLLSDNLKNQFELPVLFYTGVLLAIASGRPITDGFVTLAWVFVVSRLAHTLIHVTVNIVILRFAVFVVGFVAVILMWLQLFSQLMAS